MPDVSAILALPYIQPSQAQKHVTHNEAVATLDVLVQLVVAGFDATTPPGAPDEGETHALGSGPTGVWAGQDNMLASWRDGVWVFIAPLTGWRAYGVAVAGLRVWDGSAWVLVRAETDNLDGIGIGASHDATNRLSVSADATLLSHAGTGHQLKLNKAASGDTASLLFQSGFTGHAEMGLSGDTDFAIKVSADGSGWNDALRIAGASGNVGIGVASASVRLHLRETANSATAIVQNTNAGLSTRLLDIRASRGASSVYDFARFTSGGTADVEFRFSGDGNGSCDGSWSGGGADYAEYFEWADGNPGGQDRRGLAVVLEGRKIRKAHVGEEPVGVISGNPSMVGDAATFRWQDKYLRDDFGTPLTEGYRVEINGKETSQRRRKPNPDYDPAQAYVPRCERVEWDMVGLIGKLRLRKGQPTGARWIKMRDVSRRVEEWLVR